MKKSHQISSKVLDESGKALIVQQHIVQQAEQRLGHLHDNLDQLSQLQDVQSDALDKLLQQAKLLANGSIISDPVDTPTFNKLVETPYEQLETLQANEADSWTDFLQQNETFAATHNIDLQGDPFAKLFTDRERAELTRQIREDYKMVTPNCDRYDYAIAATCGAVAGLIDSFFVGMPGDSKLGKWTDQQVDNVVVKFAQTIWRADKNNGAQLRTEPENIAQAIGFLERKFKVNYDARYAADLVMGEETLNMRPSDHHLKSLGHSPDIIGLFFSLLDQFTGKASFIADGRIIRLEPIEGTNAYKLQGENFLAKLYCGFANWLGHLLSDISGSSGTRGHNDGRRGAGIPLPFYSLFQLCDFGSIEVNGQSKTFAEFSTAVFESGYDARFGITMAIPVAFNEIAIRLLWALKSKFYHKRSWKESLPIGNKPELRRMLLVGHGTLCVVDGADAALRAGGNPLLFATRMNMVAWSRLAFSGLLEVRSMYKEKGLDLQALERDLVREWERLGR
ncbi:hypothetical protein QT711_07635 [Sporosarcina saromensis]|uniref:Uncharacterized protein n=1 Tax=Sporosarcina saromensis TaxID=359365 RepID=A0ABU4G7V4_9BACL|nr:hypothetical protein [Sporosarcina saromensis]MDW0113054.1 hypothetical protein [Sporosarcina saromensis]